MIRYKSFVPRSKQDHRFDQLLTPNSSVTNRPNYEFTFNKSPLNKDYSQKSPISNNNNNRKKVNVVTFTPDESNELISTFTAPLNNSPTSSSGTNIPAILRPSVATLYNNNNDNNNTIGLADSASKLMAAKRKAAKEFGEISVNNNDSNRSESSKRRFSPDFLSTKRAVSPEILRPEPIATAAVTKRGCEAAAEDYSVKYYYNSDNNDIDYLKKINNNNVKINAENRNNLEIIIHNVENNINNNKGRPIINNNCKKSKVVYNHRPWQQQHDQEQQQQDDCIIDSQYRLKSHNIVYRSNSDPINNIEEAQLYDFENNDEIDCSNPNIVYKTSLCKSKSDSSYNQHQQSRGGTQANSINKKTNIMNQGKYTHLENVKEAHECQETGETQDLLDDVEYLLEGLKGNLSPSTRTLSIITLTGKCLNKSFRELLKAHGILSKIFKYLEDGFLNESVAMCTAALFLVFSRDRQPRIFDDSSLDLLLKLPRISKNQSKPSKDIERVRDKIRLLLNKFHQSNNSTNSNNLTDIVQSKPSLSSTFKSSFQRPCSCCRHLKLDNNITTEDLVVECLLQFSSRKCADWFKSLLRKQHGLDIICDQVTSSVEYLGADLGPQSLDEFVMDRLYRLFNYMRFFEHMTFQNRENQSYLLDYSEASLVEYLLRCLKLCAANLSYQSTGSQEKKLIEACLLANLRLLANISHDNEYTSNLLGNCPGLLKIIFSCLLHLPRFMSAGKRFDLSVLALALLINLVEHCSENRRRMAHVSVSRKRVACLGKCGQVGDGEAAAAAGGGGGGGEVMTKISDMGFSFGDEVEDEDMDVDEDEDEDPNEYINVDCESSEKKINILEALVKLFLRHDDRAKNNTLIEGEEEEPAEENTEEADTKDESDPKWRLVADRSLSRKNKSGRAAAAIRGGREWIEDSEEEEEDDGSSEEGADVEFMISSKEEEEELQKKLSAAGQHMQDSVVSAYTALLLGCIMKSSHHRHYMERIKEHLPQGKFKVLAFVLAKFLSILSVTVGGGSGGMGHSSEESILEIVRLLESQDTLQQQQRTVTVTIGNIEEEEEGDKMTSRPLCRSSSITNNNNHYHHNYVVTRRYNKEDNEEEEEEEDSSSVFST